MAKDRTGYAPWSLTREAGVQSATVDGTIQVPQSLQPVIDTGFVDEKGNWKGVKSSDESFFISDKAEAISNGGDVLFPNTADRDFIDMTGFSDLFVAIMPSNGGNFAISAVMGPDSRRFANLSPVNAAATLRGTTDQSYPAGAASFHDLLVDTTEALTADVWNIFVIGTRLANQKLLQFNIVNNSGGPSDIDFAYLRIV